MRQGHTAHHIGATERQGLYLRPSAGSSSAGEDDDQRNQRQDDRGAHFACFVKAGAATALLDEQKGKNFSRATGNWPKGEEKAEHADLNETCRDVHVATG